MPSASPASADSDPQRVLYSLAESGLLSTLAWNENGVLVSANQSFLELSGRTPDALRAGALCVGELFCTPLSPQDGDGGPRAVLEERELLLENGGRVPVLFGAAPLAGAPRQWAGFVLDNSEQRRRTELEELLLGIVSHDLRNPLGVISMAASLLLAQSLTELQRRLVLRLESAARRSVRLVSDLLDFTAARGAGIELVRSARDLHVIADQAIDELRATWSDRVIEHRRFGEANVFVDGDRIGQVVANLVGNALQHSPADTTVAVETRGDAACVLLVVLNYGRPIPDELLPQLFKPLLRGAKPGYRRGSLGLGLFIVQHLVMAHGGNVEVSSSEADGTRFTVRLPRAVPCLRAAPGAASDHTMPELDSMA